MDEEQAMKALAVTYFHGKLGDQERSLLAEDWRIFRNYQLTGDWERFVSARDQFTDALDEKFENDRSFQTAMDLIRIWFG